MSKIERIVAKSSFGTKAAQAARASVARARANQVVSRASQFAPEESPRKRDTKRPQ